MNDNVNTHNFGVRQYDDELGRFLCIDPLWYEQLSWSPYHYCGNDPVNGKDPEGLYIEFSNENTNEENKMANDWLNKIEKNLLGFVIVNALRNSNEYITIQFATPGKLEDIKDKNGNTTQILNGVYSSNRLRTNPTDAFNMDNKDYGEIKFKGGTIYLDKTKVTFNGVAVLGHELFHAFDDAIGRLNGSIRHIEKRAKTFENQLMNRPYNKKMMDEIFKDVFYPLLPKK